MSEHEYQETAQARRLATKRRKAAAPGGSVDKLVGFLSRFFPIAIGALLAVMIITPLSERGEVSFLLDRNKVAMINERMVVENALYRGNDDEGRPFSIKAGDAVQKSSREAIVRMHDLDARIILDDGPAHISGETANYLIKERILDVDGAVSVTAANGYAMDARGVNINLGSKQIAGNSGVSGRYPDGTFSARSFAANLPQRTISLSGDVRGTYPDGTFRANRADASVRQRTLLLRGNAGGTFPGGNFSADRVDIDSPERTIIMDGNAKMRLYPGQARRPQ